MEIALLILIVINWLMYHKIFRVYYIGNAGQSIFKEIFGCSLVAVIELAIFMAVGGWILGVFLVIGGIAGAGYIIYRIYKFVKKNYSESPKEEPQKNVRNCNISEEGHNNNTKFSQEVHKETERQIKEEKQPLDKEFCTSCGKQVLEGSRFCIFCGANLYEDEERKKIHCFDIELTAVGSNKVKVVKVLREITELDLRNAKELVDSVPQIIKKAVSLEEAENIKIKLEEQGAKVTIK